MQDPVQEPKIQTQSESKPVQEVVKEIEKEPEQKFEQESEPQSQVEDENVQEATQEIEEKSEQELKPEVQLQVELEPEKEETEKETELKPQEESEEEKTQETETIVQKYSVVVKFLCNGNQIAAYKEFSVNRGESFSYGSSLPNVQGYRPVKVERKGYGSATSNLASFIKISEVTSNEVFEVIYEQVIPEPEEETKAVPESEQEEETEDELEEKTESKSEDKLELESESENEDEKLEQEIESENEEEKPEQETESETEEEESEPEVESEIESDTELESETKEEETPKVEDENETEEEEDLIVEEESESEVEDEIVEDVTLHNVTYQFKDGSYIPADCKDLLPLTESYELGEKVILKELKSEEEPWFVFSGWYNEDGEKVTELEELEDDIVLEGYFEWVDEFTSLNLECYDGVLNPGKFEWNLKTLNYEMVENTVYWEESPVIKVNVSNKGAKTATISLVCSSKQDIFTFETVTFTIDGGTSDTFEFDLSERIKWNYTELCKKMVSLSLSGESSVELSYTFRVFATYDD